MSKLSLIIFDANKEKSMEKIINFFKDKSYGFYVTIASIIFTIITFSVYAGNYSKYDSYMSWEGFYIMIGGLVLALIIMVFKKFSWATIVLAITNFFGLLFYILKIYNYVVVVLVGIDLASFSPAFITCTTLFAINVLISTANVFFKQTRDEDVKTLKEEGAKQ